MRIDFQEDEHRYFVDGREFPAVTRMLEDERMYFNPNAREHHRTRGSAVHDGCHLISGRYPGEDWDRGSTAEKYIPYLDGYQDWCAKTGFQATTWEYRVASQLYRYCGTLDQGGHRGREFWIVDLKTGVRPQYAEIQTSLYGFAYTEMTGQPVDRLIVLELKDNGKAKPYECTPKHLAVGLGVANVWWWKQENMSNHRDKEITCHA